MKNNLLRNLLKLSNPVETDRFINISFGILILLLMLTVLLTGGIFMTNVMNKEEDKLSHIITEVLAKSISKVSFSGKYHARLLVEEIIKEQPSIKYLLVSNTQGIILAHSNPERNDKPINPSTKKIIEQLIQKPQIYTRHFIINDEPIREVSLAYRGGYKNEIIGVIQVGLSTKNRDKSLKMGIFYLTILIIILLLIGIIATHYISSFIIKPIKELANDMSTTLQAIPDLLFELDINGKYIQIMTNKEELLIDARKNLLNKTVTEALPKEAAKIVIKALQEADIKGDSYGHEIVLPIEQQSFWFELSVAKKKPFNVTQKNFTGSRFIVLSRDITQRKKYEKEINELAHIDTLTGLANRYSLEIQLEQALLCAKRNHKKIAVMFIDMDKFKDINDTLGHNLGDSFLKETAKRISRCVRKSDITGRLGGDEFIVVLTDIKSNFNASYLANKILKKLSLPYEIDGHHIFSSCSIGISYYPGDGNNSEKLMKSADMAMYHAKTEGRNNFQFFSSLMTVDNERRIKLEAELHLAIETNQFELYYQPQISTTTQEICGAEALIRWNHPEQGLISPVDFISIAEESGLILPIGKWVIQQAFKQKSLWEKQGISGVKMSLNISAHQLHSADLVIFIQELFEKYQLQGFNIEIEVTESVAMNNPQYAIKILNAIRALGIDLAIDDFGTGYSSLAYLKRLPIQTLKIDREFIRDIETDANDAAISSATIALAHALDLKVVAEGVETLQQQQFLKNENCDILQGYLYGKPMSNKDFIQFHHDFKHREWQD